MKILNTKYSQPINYDLLLWFKHVAVHKVAPELAVINDYKCFFSTIERLLKDKCEMSSQ